MASRPDTAVSTVLEGGAGLFVTEANSIQALRDLRREEEKEREEERREDETPSPTSVPLPRLPVATSPSLYPPINNPNNTNSYPPISPTNQFSKFWQTSPRRRESTSSPSRRAPGSVWRDRRDQRAESEIIARQRTYEQQQQQQQRQQQQQQQRTYEQQQQQQKRESRMGRGRGR